MAAITSVAIGAAGLGLAAYGAYENSQSSGSDVVSGDNFKSITASEKSRLKDIEDQIKGMTDAASGQLNTANSQSQDVQKLFADNLKSFLLKGTSMTPQDVQQATEFVDKTFTNPAQQVVNQNVSDYQSSAQARAASLGRNPNLDIATNQAIAGEGIRQNVGLQAERGNRIGQQIEANYNRDLAGLNAGMQGSSFLNNLTQQAFQNKMGLLNARTGLSQFYQGERGQKALGTSTSPGLLGTISSGIGQANGIISGAQKFGGSLQNLYNGYGSGGVGAAAPYTSSTSGAGFSGNYSL